jgi:16S rRNA processing protein RimM
MEGMSVYTDEGEYLGQLMEIIETRANDVYLVQQEVDGQVKELLLPDIDEVILEVDVVSKRMTVHLLDGLRD